MRREPVGPRVVAFAFGVAVVGAVGFGVVYVMGGDVRLEGVSLLVAFGGLALGLGVWSLRHMSQGPFVEEHSLFVTPHGASARVPEGDGVAVVTGRWPRRMLALAVGTLAAALILPFRSLYRGPTPTSALGSTAWRDGTVLVREDGRPIRPDALRVGDMVTLFPGDAPDAADSPVVVIRVEPERLDLAPERRDWTVDGVVAYSKLCTHAGCPVGQYLPRTGELMCPCHQSLFDAFAGAVPIAGPAARPLPQLPLGVADGVLVARGDFPEPVGPGYWRRA